ncbi:MULTISPECIES: iron-containing alcohol dehydrogenase [Clostridium]|jgi:alcohol dehydrogenase class IV|uniref:NADH-dependent butanol dehydrogenase n=7 Tax=Clostridium butyricum TaxID=1492 RepID=C4IN15_CLOBU|nr:MULTISPECIES: iron-containing alcohol dehydrogenase [Clostridium]AXB83463.1 iron-containing alcohol dehydrogenase [Clostridium butyricum]EDT74989.1 NADPH-dependent butanol dehydrogenase [Clostridium butyricum 5521]EEP52372.1 NADH-dependent butanol dehydrogenase [Clostridium butyricum E4 str. BoNT E BL5262]KHD14924.1 butanol dehydrogenase [Clostridium butyricum]KIU06318.1 NADPH-dependent butanol dehydrogenase [Clostridium butyricum]
MARFTLPRDIYHGEGSLEVLKTLKGKKAFVVVGGGSMKRFGFLQKVEDYLKEAGMEVELFEGVEPDPSVETVMKGAEAMRKFQPDWIVAMGGGSPIDAAKAMWIFYEYPDFTFEQAVVPFGLPELRQKAKFVAIPSTSGTATEVTAFSVITNYTEKIKYPLADFNITPDIAIVDPELAQTMPAKLVAHTGMDALTHAIEAYTASLRSNFSDPLAIKAIEMVNENLVKSFEGDKTARNLMHEAQCLAGMAFSNALLGIVHSMAHKVGAVFHIPHGCANAIFLPYVIKYNRKVCEDRYADIARALKLEGNTDAELTDSLIKLINEFNDDLSIPHSMKEYGVEEADFKSNVKFIAHNAILDACTGSSPREIDEETMEKLFECTYYGTDVNF